MDTALGAGGILLDVAKEAFDPLKDAMEGGKNTALGAGGILFDVAGEVGEAFGPLKAALGIISTLYEKYEVRSRPFVQRSCLMNQFAGNGCRQEKDPGSPFTHSCAGDDCQKTYE